MLPLVGGQAVSLFGDYIAYFTLPYLILALTGDAVDLGLTAAAETLPMLLFGLAAGVFLDRRRHLGRTLIGVDLIRAGTFAALAFVAAMGWGSPAIVLLVAFIAGSMAVLFDSGLQAWMAQALHPDDLVTANARLGLARTLTLCIGPLAGGIVIALAGGFTLAFGINAATFVASAGLLWLVRPIQPHDVREREHFGRAVTAGVRVIWDDRRLRWATFGGTLTNFVFQPLEALLVLYVATEVLGVSGIDEALADEGLVIGLFFALQAAIGSIGVLFAGRVAGRFPLGSVYVVGLLLLGGGFLAVALVGSWWAVLPAGIAITGVTWVNVALVTLPQCLAPQEQMGRVIAASRTLAWAGLPLGATVGGMLAWWFGVVPVYVGGASAVIVVAAFLTRTASYSDRVMAVQGP